MMRSRLLLTAALVAALCATSSAQEKFSLEYKFEKGKTYRYHQTTKGVMTQEMMGREMKVDNGSDMVTKLVVDDVSKTKEAVLIVSAESATASVKSPMMDTTMVMSQLIGKRSKIILSATGAVVKRETIDSVKMEGMRGMGSREMMKVHELPAGPVAPAGTWKTSRADTSDNLGGKMVSTYSNDYTVAGTEKKGVHQCVKVTYTSKITVNGNGKMMGMEFFIEGTGTTKGTLFFDATAGILVSDESDTNIDMTMAATG
ncbi:MAG: hypothetical protein NTV54_00255, partial [Ignavibacteriales bacterium]|nr:hypothetical protein [Ignavibacteriales bacterium]